MNSVNINSLDDLNNIISEINDYKTIGIFDISNKRKHFDNYLLIINIPILDIISRKDINGLRFISNVIVNNDPEYIKLNLNEIFSLIVTGDKDLEGFHKSLLDSIRDLYLKSSKVDESVLKLFNDIKIRGIYGKKL